MKDNTFAATVFVFTVAAASLVITYPLWVRHSKSNVKWDPQKQFGGTEVPRVGRSKVGNDIKVGTSGWTELFSEPNDAGFRGGLAMYLPRGDFNVVINVVYHMEINPKSIVRFVIDTGGAKTKTDKSDGGNNFSFDGHDGQAYMVERMKCEADFGKACEVLILASTNDPDVTVLSSSSIVAFSVPESDK